MLRRLLLSGLLLHRNVKFPRTFGSFPNVSIQKKAFWSFGSISKSFKSNDLGTIEKSAEEEPDNPRKQAALYRV